MYGAMREELADRLDEIREAGTYKTELVMTTPQGAHVDVDGRGELLNLCANNYLGLANHPEIVAAAHEALDRWGYGMASVRFICGTQALHRELEERLSEFLGTEDTILFSSCFDANGGLFEALLDERDAVISDQLNHASIIDGIRLCKARRLRYANGDMDELEARLRESADARYRLIATDGVFSMDGYFARLDAICDLAERHDALVMVDDSHAVGVVGPVGAGRHEHHGVVDRVDILTGTLGKAIGGASGGYVSARREIVEILRQRARPYLFSNSLAPPVAAASLRALDLIETSTSSASGCARTPPTSAPHDRARIRRPPRGAPDRAGDGRRRGARRAPGRRARRPRGLRRQLLLPGRAARHGAHPHADVGCAHGQRTWTSRSSSSSPRASASPADHARASGPANSVVIVLTARQLPDVVSVS